eukprot:TRINITY_DN2122_c0_g1_i1.p1 TRINITY_DN2122_c0_g1~~TRINITY_DN2122_c0_g1_i1.p1  ORF type:complete len:672 (-),score=119.81 TRINITY_DN2122_c0_g1_i1:174-2189(-)
MMIKSVSVLLIAFLALSMLTSVDSQSTPLVVGFVYNAPPTDFTWNFQLDLARLQLQETFGRDVVRTFYEVSQDDAKIDVAISSLVSRGARLIFVSSNDSKFSLRTVAANYPTVKFVVTSGDGDGDNVNLVQLRNWQCFNLLGTLAGLTSRSGRAGMVVPFRNPDIYRVVNSFYLGAKTANPKFELEVYFTANQNVYAKTRKSVELFQSSGADVVMGYLSDYVYLQEAVDRRMFTFSFPNAFSRVVYGERVLTGCVVDWTNAVTQFVNQTLRGIWSPNYISYYGAAEGGVQLATISSFIADANVVEVKELFQQLKNGTIRCTFSADELQEKGLLPSTVNMTRDYSSNGCTTTYGLFNMDYFFNGIIDHGVISDDKVFSPVYVAENSGPGIALYAVVSATNFCIFLSLLVVYSFRKRVIIAVTNEYFCYCILFGSMVGYSSIYLWIGQPSDATCLLRVWFLSIACVLIFGAIASKTYRIWRLWTNPDIKETKRSGSVIGVFIVVMGFIQVVLLIVLTVVKGYHQENVSDSQLPYDKYYDTCVLEDSGVVILALILTFNGIVVVSCAILAYASKSVSEKYNETTSIVLSIYSIIVSVVVVILLFVNIKTQDPDRQLTFIASGIFIAITCPLFSIFLPKFKVIITEYSGASSPSTGSASHSSHKTSQKLSIHTSS